MGHGLEGPGHIVIRGEYLVSVKCGLGVGGGRCAQSCGRELMVAN